MLVKLACYVSCVCSKTSECIFTNILYVQDLMKDEVKQKKIFSGTNFSDFHSHTFTIMGLK